MADHPYVPWSVIDAYQACTCRTDEADDCNTCEAFFYAVAEVACDATDRHNASKDAA